MPTNGDVRTVITRFDSPSPDYLVSRSWNGQTPAGGLWSLILDQYLPSPRPSGGSLVIIGPGTGCQGQWLFWGRPASSRGNALSGPVLSRFSCFLVFALVAPGGRRVPASVRRTGRLTVTVSSHIAFRGVVGVEMVDAVERGCDRASMGGIGDDAIEVDDAVEGAARAAGPADRAVGENHIRRQASSMTGR